MAAVISSTFKIVTTLAAGQGTTNIAQIAPGRAFRVVSVQGSGLDTATLTVSKVSAAGANTNFAVVTIAALVAGVWNAPAVMGTTVNCTLAGTDSLRLVRAVANSTQVILTCVAATGEALTETVT
jgi:hypothetical protein